MCHLMRANFSIDVGQIIEDSILDWLKGGTTGGLGHASLIYALCIAAKVPTTVSEEILHPQAAITRQKIEQYRSTIEHPRTHDAAPTHDAEPPPSSSASSTSTPDIQSLANDMAQMQLLMREQQKWQGSVDRQLGYILANQEQLAVRQDVHFQYMTQFTTALGAIFTNSALNSGPNAVSFPVPPSLPPFAPLNQPQHAPNPDDPQPDGDTS